jgi:hypothetical protein
MTDASHAHLDDEAAAYALGALDELGMARVDALVASCDQCARRVGGAELTVARLVVPADAPFRARPLFRAAWLAIAAAFVIGLLPSAYLLSRAHDAAATRAVALDALVHSHFLHAPFVGLTPDAPHAKAIYARDGSWLYVVSDAPRALTLVTEPGDRVLGTLAPSGAAASLYVATPTMARQVVELREGARPVARVTLIR